MSSNNVNSLNNSIKSNKKEKCTHNNIIKLENKIYSYCQNCGGIIMKQNLINYFISKPFTMEKQLNEDPVQLFHIMKKRSPITKEQKSIQASYLKKRKSLISDLQKLSIKLKYSDSTFYRTLYYLDNILSTVTDISTKKLTYLIIAFFLISGKFNEIDIFEPNLNDFLDFSDKFKISIDEICKYEMIALQLIEYDVIVYSTYDWLIVLLNNGFIFENEIKDIDAIPINNIYNYVKKCLAMITSRSFFTKYHPLQIAFSLIHHGRDKYVSEGNEKYLKFIQDVYDIKFSDYENCYNEISKEFSETKKKDKEKKSKKKKRNEDKENLSLPNPLSQSVEKKVYSNTQVSLNSLEKIDNQKIIFTEEKEEEYKKERYSVKHMSTKFENTLDFNKLNNSAKSKNSFVNDVDKINSIGIFGDNHSYVRRDHKLTGTIINNDKEKIQIKQKIHEKKESKFKPNK